MRLRVTDHALVRFLDRAAGLDAEGLRRQIAASLERAARVAGTLQAREYRILVDGLEYRVADGRVVTIIDPADRIERAQS